MSLLYYMFQSILNTFAFGYFFGGKKLIIFTDEGYPPPFAENSAKIINLIFDPFPYSRLSMLTRLKYVGVNTEDLLEVYKLFIRSIIEYCSVVYHSRLTEEQSNKIERIQKTCLRVILT